MPQTRILYTLSDIKNMLSRIHKVDVLKVDIFDQGELLIKDICGSEYPVTDDAFIIQVDK